MLVFETAFDDRTRLLTSNSRQVNIMPRVRIRDGSESFPKINNPRRLFEIHRASVAQFGGGAIRLEPAIADPVEYLRQKWREDSGRFLETGYYYHDAKREVYRPTCAGPT